MDHAWKKVLAVLLVCAMLLTSAGISAAAASGGNAAVTAQSAGETEKDKLKWNAINALTQGILRTICFFYPNPKWSDMKDYTPEKETILPGRTTFRTSPAENARWQVGYGRESIIPDDFEAGKYYMGRKLNVVSFQGDAKAKKVLDDQFTRAVCIDDGSGDGAVAIAVVDGIGVTSTDIRGIRRGVLAKLGKDAIASINVSATHCHSVIDTQGVSSSFLLHLFVAPICNILGIEIPGTANDRKFKAVLREKTVQAICEAYADMRSGEIYYTTLDGSEYIYDKKAPIVAECTRITSLRFKPDDETKAGTYMINMTAHPTSFSYRNTSVSSDYPFYMDKEFVDNGYNFILLTGAIGMIGRKTNSIEVPEGLDDEEEDYYVVQQYGKRLAQLILSKTGAGANEETLPPVLNAMHDDFIMTCSNYLLVLAIKCRLVDNAAYKTGLLPNQAAIPSEIGYIELGSRVGFGLYPAELYPEVYYGTTFSAADAWDGTDWQYAGENSMSRMNREGVDMYPICFANDYFGYVVPDNDFAFIAHQPDELLSVGKNAATTIVEAFIALMDQVNKAAQ